MNFDKIKLIIWDLDETFWKGTLSEGNVCIPEENKKLIINLSKRGIVNSICSKNDYEQAKEKLISEGIFDYFIFPSISWETKGFRVKSIILNCNLREENVLFIDDNPHQLAEVKYLTPLIMTATPDIIPDLLLESPNLGKNDSNLSRLNSYKILEKKYFDRQKKGDEIDFLMSSHIKVYIKDISSNDVERVVELNNRAHQLNFTKNKLDSQCLGVYLNNNQFESKLVACCDDYGDYGIIGFFVLHKPKNTLIHFVFSCRTLGMNVEQYIYQLLGFPQLTTVEPVTVHLKQDTHIDYISLANNYVFSSEKGKQKKNVLMVGPCDLEMLAFYIGLENVDTEFRIVDGESLIAYGSHPLVINNLLKRRTDSGTSLFNPLVYNSNIFSKKYKLIILSTLTSLLYGEYENNKTHTRIVFGEWNCDATKESNWEALLNGKYNIGTKVTIEELRDLSNNYSFVGRVDAKMQANRIVEIVNAIIKDDIYVCLLLGSEIPYKNNAQISLEGAEKYSKIMNDILKKEYKKNEKVKLIDPSIYIKSSSSYLNNIQHYSKKVYHDLSKEILLYFPELLKKSSKSQQKTIVAPFKQERFHRLKQFARRIKHKFFK